jgi:hypothetical protein
LKVEGVKMKKNEKKKHFALKKTYFPYFLVWTGHLALHFKDGLDSLRRRSYNILNHSE